MKEIVVTYPAKAKMKKVGKDHCKQCGQEIMVGERIYTTASCRGYGKHWIHKVHVDKHLSQEIRIK